MSTSTHSSGKSIKRIAVIGAGAAGIATAKQLIDAFSDSQDCELDLVIFEARDAVGGVWVEDPIPPPSVINYDSAGRNPSAISTKPGNLPSPIYPGLRTNLPKMLMTYRNTPFPDEVPLFPHAYQVKEYLQSYASTHGLEKYIRFNTIVTRVYLTPTDTSSDQRRWTIESRGGDTKAITKEPFDFISIGNGHYEKASLPDIPGLQGFEGRVMHSRWYRRPEEFEGQTILVVGAFASGLDISRELACTNLPNQNNLSPSSSLPTPDPSRPHTPATSKKRTTIYQSSSGAANMFSSLPGELGPPWEEYITQKGLVKEIMNESKTSGSGSVIHFQDGSTLSGIDTIIFATGYYYIFPFLHVEDSPWNEERVLDEVIGDKDVYNGVQIDGDEDGWTKGGLKGLGMKNMDELMLFLKGDRSIAFIGLPYSVVPFPFDENQAHLVALLWAGRLPSFPEHPVLPPHPTYDAVEDEVEAPATPPTENDPATTTTILDEGQKKHDATSTTLKRKPRYTELIRGRYLFGSPYEYSYSNYLLSLTVEADGGEEGGWGKVEDWRLELRKDTGLRKRTLGF